MIRQAAFPDDAPALLEIGSEFVASPSVSLVHQNNEEEFANIPGKYAPPKGCVLLAEREGQTIGCIAFKGFTPDICEMKRLYVRPIGRGHGLGRKLVQHLIINARSAGYKEMRLDVLAEFKHARTLYAELGFTPAEPISFNPLVGTEFLGLMLN